MSLRSVRPVQFDRGRGSRTATQADHRLTVDAGAVEVDLAGGDGEFPQEQPHQVEGVGTVVRQTAAAAAGGVQVPLLAAEMLLDALQIAHPDGVDLPARRPAHECADGVVVAAVERRHQRQPAGPRQIPQYGPLGRGQGEGLLDADRDPGGQGVPAQGQVNVVGHGHDEGVRSRPVQQRAVVAEACRPAGELLQSLGTGVAHGGQLPLGQPFRGGQIVGGDGAETDDAEPQGPGHRGPPGPPRRPRAVSSAWRCGGRGMPWRRRSAASSASGQPG